MMSILNVKLEKIISELDLYFYKKEVEDELKTQVKIIDIKSAVQDMWDKLPDDAKIAIYGAGAYAQRLFFDSIDLTKKNLVCVIDNNPNLTMVNGYPVIRNKDIPENKIDIVIIASLPYSDEMKSAVMEVSTSCIIIDIWEEFDLLGYVFDPLRMGIKPNETIYNKVFLNEAIRLYTANHDFRYLLYIIYNYLKFRDLINTFFFIDLYISSNYYHADKMINLKNSLDELLKEVKQSLSSKQNNHAIMIISDAMRAKDITPVLTPFLFSLGEKNIRCLNAYTHMGWTTTSIWSIFSKKSFFDSYGYNDVKLTGKEPFFKNLFQNNINFTYYCPFDKALFDDIPELFRCNQNGCADIMWQYLCSAFENDKKEICVFHFAETHEPYVYLSASAKIRFYHYNDYAGNIYNNCLKYIDSQVEFLFNLLPKKTKLLFCSDHGSIHIDSENKFYTGYKNDRFNIPYIIYDGITKCGVNKKIVSHLDTADILLNLINNRPAFNGIEHRDLAEINEEFYYAEHIIKMNENNLEQGRAFKCFIFDNEKYVIFYDGEEMYFLLPDEKNNLIDIPQYICRINWFRENVNTEFPDWSNDNGRYDVSRKYYDIDKKGK